jgi:hypothetical protein
MTQLVMARSVHIVRVISELQLEETLTVRKT